MGTVLVFSEAIAKACDLVILLDDNGVSIADFCVFFQEAIAGKVEIVRRKTELQEEGEEIESNWSGGKRQMGRGVLRAISGN